METTLLLKKPLLLLSLYLFAFSGFFYISKPEVKRYSVPENSYNAASASGTTYCAGKQFRIVILGSSTAYGKGATPIDSAWAYKYTAYVKSKNSLNTVINLAVPGYSTYEVLCPTGFIPPSNRPYPDTAKNITKALNLKPNAIIINLPTNDVGFGYSLSEIKANYERTMKLANAQYIPVWVTTSQPRTNFNQAERDSLMVLRDWTYTRFGVYAVNFWSTVANSDGSINSFYDSGDGVHVNNAGHQLFYSRMVNERILDSLCLRATATTNRYIKVNIYGGSNAYSSSSWNNWNVGTIEKTSISSGNFKYSDGIYSSIKTVLSHSLSVGDNGSTYGSTVTTKMAPTEVLRYTSYSNQTRTLTVNGLSLYKKYNIECYCSRYSSGNTTIATVNGISQTIDVFDNYTVKANFTNLTPNSSGQIVVTLKSGTTYNHLNGFMITELGSTAAGTIVKQGTLEDESATAKKPQNLVATSFGVYPNVVQDQLLLQLNNAYTGMVKMQVIDMNGRIVKEVKLVKGQQQYTYSFSLGELAKGNYLISVQGTNWRATTKIIKL